MQSIYNTVLLIFSKNEDSVVILPIYSAFAESIF